MTTDKAPEAFRTISEAAEDLDLPQHVLRFWETRFAQIKPLKRGGGRRYYRPDDVDFLRGLKHLLHAERYTIKGVQKIIKEQGVKVVQQAGKASSHGPAPAEMEPRSALKQTVAVSSYPTGGKGAHVPADARGALEAALAELTECRRVLASARAA
jgi:DNA-binding transcriptional MerR regulator